MESSVHFGGDAEVVRIEGEEQGWELVVETNSGTYRFNVHGIAHGDVLADQLAAARQQLLDWYAEGQQAAREWQLHLDRQKAEEAHDQAAGDA